MCLGLSPTALVPNERIRILISAESHVKSSWHGVTTLAAKLTWKSFFKAVSQPRAFGLLARTL